MSGNLAERLARSERKGRFVSQSLCCFQDVLQYTRACRKTAEYYQPADHHNPGGRSSSVGVHQRKRAPCCNWNENTTQPPSLTDSECLDYQLDYACQHSRCADRHKDYFHVVVTSPNHLSHECYTRNEVVRSQSLIAQSHLW